MPKQHEMIRRSNKRRKVTKDRFVPVVEPACSGSYRLSFVPDLYNLRIIACAAEMGILDSFQFFDLRSGKGMPPCSECYRSFSQFFLTFTSDFSLSELSEHLAKLTEVNIFTPELVHQILDPYVEHKVLSLDLLVLWSPLFRLV
jgi:hypothetical protein